ncbi:MULTISPECIES: response regulator transcription factor [Streptomyces]|uniref:response regulator transcription factor n=1 Tax=Streptomyces TaxID=1883 RepID=UPI0011804D10|nr:MULTISPECIES: response regulator transcription factor [unclassified Streptomyces]WTE30986.1 response regulator transcription factor [Streptomyces anulatus]
MTEELADRLRDADVGVKTEHRHIDRPILSGVAGGLLTDQELAALYLFARGRRQEIAEALRVSPETVGRLLHGHGWFSGRGRSLSRPVRRAVFWNGRAAGPRRGREGFTGPPGFGSWAAGQLGQEPFSAGRGAARRAAGVRR